MRNYKLIDTAVGLSRRGFLGTAAALAAGRFAFAQGPARTVCAEIETSAAPAQYVRSWPRIWSVIVGAQSMGDEGYRLRFG